MASDERIDPEVIEAARQAFHRASRQGGKPMEAAIRATDQARGLREERTIYDEINGWSAPNGLGPDEAAVRLVTDWRSVEQSS